MGGFEALLRIRGSEHRTGALCDGCELVTRAQIAEPTTGVLSIGTVCRKMSIVRRITLCQGWLIRFTYRGVECGGVQAG